MRTFERPIALDPLSAANIGKLVEVGPTSDTPYFELPHDEEAGAMLLSTWEGMRQLGYGDYFLAFTGVQRQVLVGGCYMLGRQGADRISTAGWVVQEHRGQGYGRAILTAVETRAANRFPDARLFETEVDPQNTGGVQRLMTFAGYEATDRRDRDGRMVFQKLIRPVMED